MGKGWGFNWDSHEFLGVIIMTSVACATGPSVNILDWVKVGNFHEFSRFGLEKPNKVICFSTRRPSFINTHKFWNCLKPYLEIICCSFLSWPFEEQHI